MDWVLAVYYKRVLSYHLVLYQDSHQWNQNTAVFRELDLSSTNDCPLCKKAQKYIGYSFFNLKSLWLDTNKRIV